ncbi:UDP-glucose 4-epimerase [Apilactobacillus ozensis DSM 23829 = JCM 17196]|uniref:UDP-glucose 4-epimerase n=1 Tax=Apilactobacillus ozensis DSM 23829 = JCM 17196 TaxID=1423781 RepID=A0A0R2ASQ3_9LACO|nr:UDP-glucose 4-epimerase GalE [Apilactobacillus ozensis]KRM69911.1 UDP-glucose 4-epimerase [Apilactobacillus ozensis DSM 23829 = JCM 17196]
MTILVPGGAGYIGSHTVNYLIKNGYDVAVVDNLATGYSKSVNPKARLYEGDIRDKEFMSEIFDKESIDAVIHFAGSSIVPESMNNPIKYFDNNVYGMITLLEMMEKYHVKNLVFSSSAAVYGEPKQVPIKESDITNPTNPYGESKLIIERIMKWADKAYGINSVALRYFNVGGASVDGSIGENHNPETHLIPIVLQVAEGKRDKLQIYGTNYDTNDGTNIRDYVHVVDLADAHVLAMQYLLNGGKSDVFNLGSSHGFSNMEILDAARKVTNKGIPAEFAARRPGDPATLIADSTKARTVLNWQPKYENVEKIIQSAWNFVEKHPNGLSK